MRDEDTGQGEETDPCDGVQQKAFLILKFENYCEEKLQYQDGNIATTKKDKRYHGYGMKSIRYTVNKYDGAVSIDTKELSLQFMQKKCRLCKYNR